jgi:hypothetical protein
MKRLLALAPLLLLAACGDGSNDSLMGNPANSPEMAVSPNSAAAGVDNTQHHFQESTGGDNGLTDPAVAQAQNNAIGSPEAVARLHASQKIQYAALGRMLADFGVDLTNMNDGSAGALYRAGGSALGMPVYANRVPEMSVPSTASLAKEYDIFTAAAPEILANIGMSKRCPGVVLIDMTSNQFTQDGVSCLMGKPARPEHLALANQLVGEATTPQIGQQIAIAALLAAAHTSE